MSVLSPRMMEQIARIERNDENPYFEIVDGNIVLQPPKTVYASLLASRLAFFLQCYANAMHAGFTVVRAVFELKPHGTLWRRPEVAFVSHERWPLTRKFSYVAAAWGVIPSFAVEIVNSTNRDAAFYLKIDDYFNAGVQLVWIIDPMLRCVDVLESPTAFRLFTEIDTLDGGKVLPQFRLALKDLFND